MLNILTGIYKSYYKEVKKQLYEQGHDKDYYLNPKNIITDDVKIKNVPILQATNENLKGYGFLFQDPSEVTVENKRFEIEYWPTKGWRKLDPGTGNEGGTTEGDFMIYWDGDSLYGKNLAIATESNHYLLGTLDGSSLLLWNSDYHPDGGQLFFPKGGSIPFVACLGLPSLGDDVTPTDMKAFYIPKGYGLYIHPSTWHNAVYIHPQHAPAELFGRQGKVHARIGVNWVKEFNTLLRIPLNI